MVWAYTLLVLVAAPVMAWRLAASGLLRKTPRTVVYRGGMTTSWLLALAGAAVLWWEQDTSPAQVGLIGLPPVAGVAWSAGTLAMLLLGLGLFGLLLKLLRRGESPDVLHLIPETRGERWLFVGLALTAGVTEEFIYRGIALTSLMRLPGLDGPWGPWLAAALVALAFGLGHGYQSVMGMLRAGVLGFVLAVPLLLSGSLLPGMAAHAVLDLTLLARSPASGRRHAATPQPDLP
ncbi:MAG: CPBP family intramembrane metalloprotease [Acidobacteria bacterium]|nr:CPBP family intramembrane metalloprotease [Acidobacteriota bacterium]